MRTILWFMAWEWINIALEYTATAWVRLPRWFAGVAAVNLLSHPPLMFLLGRFGAVPRVLFPAEAAVVVLETALLALFYRRHARPVPLAGIALLMNAASYATGFVLSL